ncbi:hypothetical protein L249_8666 [Ophiocordyceps polyrhachis-furcata BCC 54312]|uniref:Xylanolytic transcriptional activator regulatory domain-containing protein n=1 Tax=Ophiocordyceps polyrhachis-furcata BCC 54312 TaxID=1330021 RepID=A0A367L6Z5_9HYPO|nr:hypothetical protein L249_8666 [Ophiocordyceps polyrhachis-furcata BCC 54312]
MSLPTYLAPPLKAQRSAPIAIAPKPSHPSPSPFRLDGALRPVLDLDLQHRFSAADEDEGEDDEDDEDEDDEDDDDEDDEDDDEQDDDEPPPPPPPPSDEISSRSRKRKLNGSVDAGLGKKSSPGLQYNSSASSSSLLDGPAMLRRTLGLQTDRYSQYIGPTTDFEPSLINLSAFDPHDESLLSRGLLRKVSDNDTFLMLADRETPGFDRIVRDSDAIEAVVAPHGRSLIDLYFDVVHPAFPIIEKHVFMQKYDSSHRHLSPPILAAIYILAINWWDQSGALAGLPPPDVRELERLVRSTLQDDMNRPRLSTIQAGLLLSQRPQGDQWAPTAQLVAVGQELGLHLDCSGWKIPSWEKGLRRRLAWALYMQDKWGALVHGRPSHILAANWAVRPVSAHDFPDAEAEEVDQDARRDIQGGRLLFTRAIQLSEILAEILETFYTLQSARAIADAVPQATQLVLSMAKPVQLRLKEWYAGLPNALRLDPYSAGSPPATTQGLLPSIGHLHLAYYATEITLHRRIIRSLASDPASVDPYVQHICRGAAKARLISAMDFVNRLTPAHLRSFWYFASKTNFALIGTFGSLLWATSPGREEADWYRRRLAEYRWTLSVSSKPGEGCGLTEFAMTMLDISTGLLKQLPEKPSMSQKTGLPGPLAGPSSFGPPFSSSATGSGAFLNRYTTAAGSDISGEQSPGSGESTSDDEMDGSYTTPA